jgi:hypothetical protein
MKGIKNTTPPSEVIQASLSKMSSIEISPAMQIHGGVVTMCTAFTDMVDNNRNSILAIKALVKSTKLMMNRINQRSDRMSPSEVLPMIGIAEDYAIAICPVEPMDAVGCEELRERWGKINESLIFIQTTILDANQATALYTRAEIAEACAEITTQIALFEEYSVYDHIAA